MERSVRERLAKRLGLMPRIPPITIRNDAPESFRAGLIALIDPLFDPDDLRTLVCGAIGQLPDSTNWSRGRILREILRHIERCHWLMIYEVVEAVYEKLLNGRFGITDAKEFENRINGLFVDWGIGFQMIQGTIRHREEPPAEPPPDMASDDSSSVLVSELLPSPVPSNRTRDMGVRNGASSEITRKSKLRPLLQSFRPAASPIADSMIVNTQAETTTGDISITIQLPSRMASDGDPDLSGISPKRESAAPHSSPANAKSNRPGKYALVMDPVAQTVELHEIGGTSKARNLGVIIKPEDRKLYQFIVDAMENGVEQKARADKDTARRVRNAIRVALKNEIVDFTPNQGGDWYRIDLPIVSRPWDYKPEPHQNLADLPEADSEHKTYSP